MQSVTSSTILAVQRGVRITDLTDWCGQCIVLPSKTGLGLKEDSVRRKSVGYFYQNSHHHHKLTYDRHLHYAQCVYQVQAPTPSKKRSDLI